MATLVKGAIFRVLDTETTGLDPATDKVVEVAGVRVSLEGGILSRWSSLVNPGIPVPAISSAIHHLTDEDVADAPALEAVLPKFREGEAHVLVAHNAAFDMGFLPDDGLPVLCTCRLAKKLWPDLESFSNQFLRYHFKIPCPEVKGLAAHRAEADALVTAKVLRYELRTVISRAKDPDAITVEGLVAWANSPILYKTCNFGKHRGTAWCDVPKDYLQWMLGPKGMTDLDPDTHYTAEHYLKA